MHSINHILFGKVRFSFPVFFCLVFLKAHSQDWVLRLKSNVELRTYTLTSQAYKNEKPLQGATIKLYNGANPIGETTSNSNGDFEIDVPPHGDFVLTVSFPNCYTKKFFVSTKGVPEDVGKKEYKPTFGIGGFILAKPFSGVDYIGLNDPLVKVEYKSKGQNFGDNEAHTQKGLDVVTKIYNDENSLITKFCGLNKQGDDALRKKNCPLAKECYTKAKNLIPGEPYPVEMLEKVEECLKEREMKDQVAKEEAAAKADAAKQAQDKALAAKAAKDKALFDKAAADRAAKEKASADKNNSKKKDNAASSPKKAEPAATHTTQPKKDNASATKSFSYETGGKPASQKSSGKSNAKYKMPQQLGTDQYKVKMSAGEDYFRDKRYKEAKASFQDALKLKPNDATATARIAECDKLLGAK